MIAMTVTKMAEIMGGELYGTGEILPTAQFQFDSRAINPGDIFLALQGDKTDGHQYVGEAASRGAVLSVVTQPVTSAHILVTDVLVAIAKLALYVRKQLSDLKVIGITGSQGKTTTKDMLFSILKVEGETIAAPGSYNNDLGVPLTLLRCNEKTKFCIVEMGARHTGDIATLTKIAVPNVGAVLKVGNAHIGEFGSREKIAATKGELAAGLESGAVAVLGSYDEFTPQMPTANGVKRLTFGDNHDCDVRAADIEFRGGYAFFDLVTPDAREGVELRVLGLHQIPNALAAAAIAFSLGVSTTHIAAALSMHESASKWRMEIHEGNGAVLINDAYNANPESMEAALRTLVLLTQERGGRSWALLGTMHELGPSSAQMHQEIGALAVELGIDHLVSIGNQDYLRGIDTSATTTHYFGSVEEARTLISAFEAGDVILIKASRAEHLELLADAVIASWSEELDSEDKGEMQ